MLFDKEFDLCNDCIRDLEKLITVWLNTKSYEENKKPADRWLFTRLCKRY